MHTFSFSRCSGRCICTTRTTVVSGCTFVSWPVPVGGDCWITALHVSRQNVCVGLTNGKILILQLVDGAMLPWRTFCCHQHQVSCLTTLPPDITDKTGHSHGDLSWHRARPFPTHLLVSCGLGFHSYPTLSSSEQPGIPHPNALPQATLLVWDLASLQ